MEHGHRDNLAGEHRTGDLGQLTILLLFMALWLSDMFLEYSNFLNEYVPLAVRLSIGVLLLIVSGYMAKTGLSLVFGRNAQSHSVIRKGVFGLVRHPIYLSEIIFYLGLLALYISLAAVFTLVIAILFLHYISRYEEKLLLAKYGKEYEQYMKEVPMWFPRLYRSKKW
ncbi:methyltransferase family protein [Chloroflexota bacterium]